MDSDLVQALVRAIELKDHSTAAHTWRVVLYTQALCDALGLDHDHIERAVAAAALHDIGKVDIPDGILAKPGRLTEDEFAVMRTHTTLGHARLLAMGETDPLMLALVRSHHERIDGTGYPDALAGEAVPIPARYFAVVDSFDAMTSVRPYRNQVGPDAARRALTELRDGVGSRYFADCVTAFTDIFEHGHIDWILEYYNDAQALPPIADPPSAARMARSSRSPFKPVPPVQ